MGYRSYPQIKDETSSADSGFGTLCSQTSATPRSGAEEKPWENGDFMVILL